MSEESAAPPVEDLGTLLRIRREKMDHLRALGVDPFGKGFETTHAPGALREAFAEGMNVRIAGRITALRDMGKSNFLDLSDLNGRIQAFVNKGAIGDEAWEIYKQLDIGDWIGISGETFLTKTGEPSVKALEVTVLSKSLRPMPSKWHGVVDPQIKYRQRYLDLIANERSREIFKKRCLMVAEIRRYCRSAASSRSRRRCCRTSRRRRGPALPDAPQRARDGHVPPHRPRALPEAPPRGRIREGLRTEPQLPQRGHQPPPQSRVHHARGLLGLRGFREDGGPRRGSRLSSRGKILRRASHRAPQRRRRTDEDDQPRPALEARPLSRPRRRRGRGRLVVA